MTPYTTISFTRRHADGADTGVEIVISAFCWDFFWGRNERSWTVSLGPVEVRRTHRPRVVRRARRVAA